MEALHYKVAQKHADALQMTATDIFKRGQTQIRF